MHRALPFCLILLVAITTTAEPKRDILWMALQTCILNKKITGKTFPCLALDLGKQGQPGIGVLRAPGLPTHTVIMPTDDVVGLEAPVLQCSRGASYLQEALAARRYVADALRGRLAIEDVGLAVNGAGGRSQDHLHIHLDCVKPGVRLALQRYAASIGKNWTPTPISLEGNRIFALWVPADEVNDFNPFAALSRLPGREPNLLETSFAVISAPTGVAQAGYFVLAYRSSRAYAEMLLDHRCSVVAKAAAN